LTAKGRAQATAAGRLLKSLVGDAVPLSTAVSPLGRAQETARLVSCELPLMGIFEPRIAEVSIGAWDGLTDFEIEAEYPGALAGATAFDWFFRSPDGETLDCVIDRVSEWLGDNTTTSARCLPWPHRANYPRRLYRTVPRRDAFLAGPTRRHFSIGSRYG
jgi:broad specificity phosphatase PhoE